MTEKKNGTAIVINALVWATLMLATSYLLKDAITDQKNMLMMLHIGGWFITNGLLTNGGRSAREELACIRKKFSKGN